MPIGTISLAALQLQETEWWDERKDLAEIWTLRVCIGDDSGEGEKIGCR